MKWTLSEMSVGTAVIKPIFASLLVGLIMGVYLLAWHIQDTLFLNWDISYLMNITRSLLAGGTYTGNFFTPNPPMIFYLYVPPLIFSKLTTLSIILSFRIYIFLLATLSLFLCYLSLHKLLLKQSHGIFMVLMAALALVYLVLPVYQFGQRDHLLIILTMPYILLVACRLKNIRINPSLALIIGLLAGLGFAIKPQFLLTPLLIELYYLFSKKQWQACVRVETLAIGSVLLFYVASIFVFHADFIFIIFPYIIHAYYRNIGNPWSNLVTNDIVLFSLFPIIFYMLQYKDSRYKALSTLLFLALIGALFAFFTQRITFFYHLIPSFSLTILLLVVLMGDFIEQYRHWFVLVMSAVVFAVPLYIGNAYYQLGLGYKHHTLNRLIAFMKTQPPHQSIYVLSEANYGAPLIDYTGATAAQRFDCLWMLKDLLVMQQTQGDSVLRSYLKNNTDKYFFLNLIADDLATHKPSLVFVDVRRNNMELSGQRAHFYFLSHFLENKNFYAAWQSYVYFTTIGGASFDYQLQVYKRKEAL